MSGRVPAVGDGIEAALEDWVMRRLGMELSPLSVREGAEQIMAAASSGEGSHGQASGGGAGRMSIRSQHHGAPWLSRFEMSQTPLKKPERSKPKSAAPKPAPSGRNNPKGVR